MRKLNKLTTLILLLMLCIPVIARGNNKDDNRLKLGFKTGGGFSSFTEPLTNNGLTNYHGAFHGGLALYKPFSGSIFSIQSELTYNFRMFKDENSDLGDHDFVIHTIELPLMLNTRLFKYDGKKGLTSVNLVGGFGYSRGLRSRMLTDSSVLKYDYGWWEEHEYRQLNDEFAAVRKNNSFYVLGINTRFIDEKYSAVGLRYTKYLKSVYEINEVTEDFNFTTQAWSISLDLTFCF